MSAQNVPLNELLTTEGMDFSYRGTPLTPELPEHYANKRYVDTAVRASTTVNITCDGEMESYTITHNLNTLNIATVQIYDTTGGSALPIAMDWTPSTVNTIVLHSDVSLPVDMTLRVVVTA
jgi:hypothetical protein